MSSDLNKKAQKYLDYLCRKIPTRVVGSDGNRKATKWFAEHVETFGFQVETPEFDCMDWTENSARLFVDGREFNPVPSPYTLGFQGNGELCVVRSVSDLTTHDFRDKILLMLDELVKEPLMPKNFIFYNPEHHQEIISLLEAGQPRAIITATGRDPMLASNRYPFPVIEDGDFNIPSVFIKDTEGEDLATFIGEKINLSINSVRNSANGYNVIACKGDPDQPRIIITAHIDAKQGTPGALYNGTGIVALLLLAELLKDYKGTYKVEIVALNGEDFYSVPGQMQYYNANQGRWNDIFLAINIDGAGYYRGNTSYCTFNCSDILGKTIHRVFDAGKEMVNGPQWVESDHSIFVQQGRPAMAVISEIFLTDKTLKITHSPKDHPDIVDIGKIADIASLLSDLIFEINQQ